MGPLFRQHAEDGWVSSMDTPLSGEVKNCAVFDVLEYRENTPRDSEHPTRPSRVMIARYILDGIASGLREAGYEVADAKRGQGCDAVTHCKLNGWSVVLTLNVVKRNPNAASCHLRTWRSQSLRERLLRCKAANDYATEEVWNKLCRAADRALNQHFKTQSLEWVTRDEATRRWSGQDVRLR